MAHILPAAIDPHQQVDATAHHKVTFNFKWRVKREN